jgi:hypothetical protein
VNARNFFTELKRPQQTFTSSWFLLCLAGKHHASLKSAACLCVSITLPAFIVNANHSPAAKFRVVDCFARLQVPQATEWERIGDEIDDALVAARGAFRKVLASGLDARLLRLF